MDEGVCEGNTKRFWNEEAGGPLDEKDAIFKV